LRGPVLPDRSVPGCVLCRPAGIGGSVGNSTRIKRTAGKVLKPRGQDKPITPNGMAVAPPGFAENADPVTVWIFWARKSSVGDALSRALS